MNNALEKLTPLIDADCLQERIGEMAAQIEADLVDGEAVLVVVLKGGFLFGADLLRAIARPLPVAFVFPRARGEDPVMTAEDRALMAGRDLVVADALLDGGDSISQLRAALQALGARSIRLAVLLHKTLPDAYPTPVDYLGFEAPNVRLVGYGLDEDQRFRGLAGIHAWWGPAEEAAPTAPPAEEIE